MGQFIRTKPKIEREVKRVRYKVSMMAPWYYFGNKTEPLGHMLIEGYGHTIQSAWEQFEYWWLTLMGEPYQSLEKMK